MDRNHEEEVRRNVYYSDMPCFAIGLFFTISICFMIHNKAYIVLAGFIPLIIIAVRKLWKDGEFRDGGLFIFVWFLFIQIPMLVYLLHDVISKGIYWYPILLGLMYFPGIISEYVKDIRREKP